jgi:hypothetical protein
MRDFCYVVRYCYIATANPGKNREVPGCGQIGAEQAATSNLQLDSEQSVLNDDTSRSIRFVEMVRAGAKLADALAIDSRQPRFTELLLDFVSVIFCGHYLCNLCLSVA